MSTPATAPLREAAGSNKQVGIAWVLLCLSLALHVTDEALTGFLSVYNPTVIALRARLGFWPMPTFGFREWLSGLIAGCVILLALSPLVFRGSRWIRPLFYLFAVIMVLNGLAHTAGTIMGHTFPDIRFSRPMPGFYSSPLVLAAAIYALVQLRKTRSLTT